MSRIQYILILSILVLAFVEVGLRVSGKLKTYSEKNFGTYQSAYDASKFKPLYVWSKNDSIYTQQTEFAFPYLTNEHGLLKRLKPASSSSEKSIVFLGDSFVFGVGAPQDSSLPVLLENQINIPLINAGVPGSDPFFENILLDSIFKPQNFRNYLIMINVSDLYDYATRGGNERFQTKAGVYFRSAPPIEKYYEKSFVVRALCHSILQLDYSLLSKKELVQRKKEAIASYVKLFEKIAQEVNLIIIIQPYSRQYANNPSVLTEVLKFNYLDSLEARLHEKNINCINLDDKISSLINDENYLNYSWKIDGHFNAKGYALISEILANELTLNYPEFINIKD